MNEQKSLYEQYCKANSVLHLTGTQVDAIAIEEVVKNGTRKGKRKDWVEYYYWSLMYGNIPSDEVMFPEKGTGCFFDTNFASYDMVVVWHSTDAPSLLFLYCMCRKFIPLGIPLYEIDVRKARQLWSKSKGWPLENDFGERIYGLSGFLDDAESYVTEITKDKMLEFDALWKEIADNPTELRAMKDGRIISVSVDYYDDLILSVIPEDGCFRKAAKIVGEALSFILHYAVGDSFVYDRLIELCKAGKVEARLSDQFDFKAYRDAQILMEGFPKDEFDKDWLVDFWPPMRFLEVRRCQQTK